MAKNPKRPLSPTKKHQARLERERIQTRNILLGSAIVIILVIATILYGILDQTYLRARQPVAVVNGDRITTSEFQGQVRYGRYTLIRNALNTYQFMQLFGDDPSTMSSFVSQLQQIQFQLIPTSIGNTVLDQMVEDRLIRQEATRRGITVTEEDMNQAFQEAFGFYPEGTPTPTQTFEPLPTSTLSPLQQTLVPPTATPTEVSEVTETPEGEDEAETDDQETTAGTATPAADATPEPTPAAESTPTATSAPTPTATPYTLEGYQTLYRETVENFKNEYGISEADLRRVIESQLYRERVMEAVIGEIPGTQEQVWARHILVADEQTANDILARLNNGEDFCALAAEFSTDTTNKDACGDLGWFARGQMVTEFEEVAFEMQVGEISQPVTTTFGSHIIQLLGHEERPISDAEREQLRQEKFQEWLTEQRESSDVEIKDNWAEQAPTEPALPPEIEQVILQSQQQPALPTPAPVEPEQLPADNEEPAPSE